MGEFGKKKTTIISAYIRKNEMDEETAAVRYAEYLSIW